MVGLDGVHRQLSVLDRTDDVMSSEEVSSFGNIKGVSVRSVVSEPEQALYEKSSIDPIMSAHLTEV